MVEEVEDLVNHPMRRRTVSVDLVDDEHGVQAGREGLAGDEARLRHGTFHRVHQQEHRVDHRQDAFDLPAEVGVTRGVHDVDAATRVLHRGRLRQDGDTALALQLVAVQRPLGDLDARVGQGLLQQTVHERGLAVVDMGDDGDVADVHRGARIPPILKRLEDCIEAGHQAGYPVNDDFNGAESGNTSTPPFMIGEKAAEFLRGK